jgi:hypothetical protein
MKVYAINENEVSTISSFNTQATFYFAIASFLTSAILSVYTNAAFYSQLTPAGQLATAYAPYVLAIAAAFFAMGLTAIWRRRRLWENIKSESTSK